MLLRPARESDYDAVYDLICELAFFEGKDISKLPLRKENLLKFGFDKNPSFFCEVAEIESEIVGYALYFFTFSAHQGYPVLYLDDLYVKIDFRGQGIGTKMLKKMAEYAQQRQCCRMEWHVFDWNQPAIDFYKKIGGELRSDLIHLRVEKEALNKLTVT